MVPFEGESRPVKYAVAGSFTSVNLESQTGSADANTSTFDYFALNFPVGRFGVGVGALPYTSVGYKLQDLADNGDILNRYTGEGGLNKVFAGVGYKITEKLSIGVDMNYNFGNIKNSALAYAYSEGLLLQFQTRENNRSDLSGLSFNLGMAYHTMITRKLELQATATFAPESNLTSENTRSYSTIVITNNGREVPNSIRLMPIWKQLAWKQPI